MSAPRSVTLALALLLSALPTIVRSGGPQQPGETRPPGETQQPGETRQTGAGRIKGSVIDPSGRPQIGALVTARITTGDIDRMHVATTDDSGTYVLGGLPAGIYQVEGHARGFARALYADVNVRPPFRNILDFRLQAGAGTEQRFSNGGGPPVQVSGLVTGPDGRPVADAETALLGGPPPGQRIVATGGTGQFLIPEVPASVYELRVTAPGALPIRIPGVSVIDGRALQVRVQLLDYPVEMATRDQIVLPKEEPLPPRTRLPLPEHP